MFDSSVFLPGNSKLFLAQKRLQAVMDLPLGTSPDFNVKISDVVQNL